MQASGNIPLPPIPLKKTGESIIAAPYWRERRAASGAEPSDWARLAKNESRAVSARLSASRPSAIGRIDRAAARLLLPGAGEGRGLSPLSSLSPSTLLFGRLESRAFSAAF